MSDDDLIKEIIAFCETHKIRCGFKRQMKHIELSTDWYYSGDVFFSMSMDQVKKMIEFGIFYSTISMAHNCAIKIYKSGKIDGEKSIQSSLRELLGISNSE